MTKILLIDDDRAFARALSIGLGAHGYEVVVAHDGREGIVAATRERPDIMLLDLGLPEYTGMELLEAVRLWSDVPVIVLSARHQSATKVAALDAGADDYITKPFKLAELLARIRVRLRLATPRQPPRIQGVLVDPEAHRAWQDDVELDLTPKEFDVLTLLVVDAGRVVARQRLMQEVWDEHYYGSTRTLDMHISSLRKKLSDDPNNPRLITTVRGVGFRFETG